MTQKHEGSGDNVAGNKTVNHNYPEGYQKPNPAMGLDSPKIQISKLPHTNSQLFGREDELTLLDEAWQGPLNILILKALGGSGKTALMKTWLDHFAVDKFRGANAVYTWSFYSQGSAEDKQASADEFFDAALNWFGYSGDPLSSAHNKGLKLAELINQQRTLLVLDGLEPLQYPEGGAMDGALRDAGLKALFAQLAMQNQGLLLISSRQHVVELSDKPESLVIQHELQPLSIAAGTELFKAADIKGNDDEFEEAINKVNGHALSLNLLAKYLSTYEDSDIRQRGNLGALSDFPEETRDTRHAFKVMAAYEKQLQDTTELQILYMLGLFDRPVSVGAIKCLRQAAIEHISDNQINDKIFKAATERLRQQDLLNKPQSIDGQSQPSADNNGTLDAHPLVREYFGKRLQQQYPTAWQQAHAALFDYFKDLPDKQLPDTLNEMEPLFAAIAHGCAAGLHQQAAEEVYYPRILREGDAYINKKLGANSADLSALSHFFEKSETGLTNTMGWQTPAAGLTDMQKASVLGWAAFSLRALGRLQEAVEPMQAGMKMRIKQEDWKNAAGGASNFSELQLTRGLLLRGADPEQPSALEAAEQSVQLADKSGDALYRMLMRTALADAQHQAGELTAARQRFAEAEKLQQERQPEYPQLCSVRGFRYCDLLLTAGEWREVQQRAGQAIKIAEQNNWLLENALDQLSLGRASLQQAIAEFGLKLETVGRIGDAVTRQSQDDAGLRGANPAYKSSASDSAGEAIPISPEIILCVPNQESTLPTGNNAALAGVLQTAEDWLNQAVDGLRKAGQEDYLARGLLVRANYHRWVLSLHSSTESTANENPDEPAPLQSALDDLKEAHDIAERGEMRLFLTDYHLESARLILTLRFNSEQALDQTGFDLSAAEHIQKARQIIEVTGYKRRLPELLYLEKLLP